MDTGRILIAGGGLGGLTAAACLLRAGFDVTVHEQAARLGEIGAGVQISPNASRVLDHLELTPALRAVAAMPDSYRFRLFDSGEMLQTIPLGDAFLARHGVPYVTLHRADLHDLLARRTRALKPDAIRLGARVVGFDETESGVTLRLEDGGESVGDALIGADGVRSVIRERIVGAAPAVYSGDIAWRVTVPADALPESSRPSGVQIWVGPGRHAVLYPLRRGALINMVGLVDHEVWREESWTAPGPWEELKADFHGWHPMVQTVIDAARGQTCYRWALNTRRPLRAWSTRRATLLGDAAHPTLPYMAQGAAMAIEDAAVLARALAQAPDIAAGLDLYQRNRVDRTTRIVEESNANAALFHLPTVAALRDAFATRDINSERNAWLFSYDPIRTPLT